MCIRDRIYTVYVNAYRIVSWRVVCLILYSYSYLQPVERAYIAAQAEIVDILHKEQHQRKNKKVRKKQPKKTQIRRNQDANIVKLYNNA